MGAEGARMLWHPYLSGQRTELKLMCEVYTHIFVIDFSGVETFYPGFLFAYEDEEKGDVLSC